LREYQLELPAGVVGECWLELSEAGGQRVKLLVQPAGVGEVVGKPGLPSPEAPRAKRFDPGTNFNADHFLKRHIFGHEPMYFIAGPDSPNAKFQISFKYRLLMTNGYLASKWAGIDDLYMAYTQVSLWELSQPSAPFFDSSYKPEFLYWKPSFWTSGARDWLRLDLQSGFQHESNGKSGASSRSMNMGYLQPTLVLGRDDQWQFKFGPRAWFYLGDVIDNPDIAAYRGYVDLRASVGKYDNLVISAYGRMGDAARHGSLQLDATFPLWRLPGGLSWYLHAQYFTGYGESFLLYRERSDTVRAGFSLSR
jgi:outer membrane phospholipase A